LKNSEKIWEEFLHICIKRFALELFF